MGPKVDTWQKPRVFFWLIREMSGGDRWDLPISYVSGCLFLFMSQGYYWVYVCGSYGGVEAEDDAYCDADAD